MFWCLVFALRSTDIYQTELDKIQARKVALKAQRDDL
jgi:hypothetical protein